MTTHSPKCCATYFWGKRNVYWAYLKSCIQNDLNHNVSRHVICSNNTMFNVFERRRKQNAFHTQLKFTYTICSRYTFSIVRFQCMDNLRYVRCQTGQVGAKKYNAIDISINQGFY